MKVLIVCSGNYGYISPFILEQANSLKRLGVDIDFFPIKGKGWLGYLLNYPAVTRKIKSYRPSIIHAHYGLSGLLANLQRTVPVITTFHGSDINDKYVFKYSKWALKLSAASIFVENGMMQKESNNNNCVIIPCGVDISVFYPISKPEASENLGINSESTNILFSSAFNNPVKNYPLAMKSCHILETNINVGINLIELKGYTREQVNLLMNTCDCVLLTSFSEGSSQFIKEAMASNCPIVTTNVGDVNLVLGNVAGCFITSFVPADVAEKLKEAIDFRKKHRQTSGRQRIIELGLDSVTIAGKIMDLYKKVLNY
jgi:teichuronic acid biosynthesis glycosyltransferase TuaC